MAKRTYDLQLRGFVGGYAFDPEYLSWYLDKHASGPVTVLIESRGGQLAAGISVASAIRDHADVSVHFVGMNASAATIASLGAKHISMACDAWYLVHKASIEIFEWASLNADQIQQRCKDLEKKAAELAKFDVAISEMYSRRCKKSPKDMLALMSKETWLTAKEALEWGFIDEITDLPDDIHNEITDQVLADFSSQGISLPEQLLKSRDKKDDSLFSKIINLLKPSQHMDPVNNNQTQPAQDNNAPESGTEQSQAEINRQILSRLDSIEARLNPDAGNSSQQQPGSSQQPVQNTAQPPVQNTALQPQDSSADQSPSAQEQQIVNTGYTPQKSGTFAASMKSAASLFNSLP